MENQKKINMFGVDLTDLKSALKKRLKQINKIHSL